MVDDKNLRFKCNVVPTIQILEPPDYFDPYTMITGARVSCGLTLVQIILLILYQSVVV